MTKRRNGLKLWNSVCVCVCVCVCRIGNNRHKWKVHVLPWRRASGKNWEGRLFFFQDDYRFLTIIEKKVCIFYFYLLLPSRINLEVFLISNLSFLSVLYTSHFHTSATFVIGVVCIFHLPSSNTTVCRMRLLFSPNIYKVVAEKWSCHEQKVD